MPAKYNVISCCSSWSGIGNDSVQNADAFRSECGSFSDVVTENEPTRRKCLDVAVSIKDFLKGPQTGGMVREPRAAYRVRQKK
jgi:hypothetical protein